MVGVAGDADRAEERTETGLATGTVEGGESGDLDSGAEVLTKVGEQGET